MRDVNWTAVDQQNVYKTADARPLVYHSHRQPLSTARFRRAGLITTADTGTVSLKVCMHFCCMFYNT